MPSVRKMLLNLVIGSTVGQTISTLDDTHPTKCPGHADRGTPKTNMKDLDSLLLTVRVESARLNKRTESRLTFEGVSNNGKQVKLIVCRDPLPSQPDGQGPRARSLVATETA
jgi:hypothetical protein